jgi:hypothetical protein
VHAQGVGVFFKQRVHQINEFLLALFLEHVFSHLYYLVLIEPVLNLLGNDLRVLLVVLVVNECVHAVVVRLLDCSVLFLAKPFDQSASLLSACLKSSC